KEGDGKSPAGVFELGTVFGFAPAEQMKGLHMPYLQITESMECVDDVRSKYYNRILDRRQVENPDWQSSEKMRKIFPEYELGVVVNYNTREPEAGIGSCIFLHIRGGPDKPTSGCTAMSTGAMKKLAFWLDGKKHPVIVQLTKPLYQQLIKAWALPEVE
ncbi:MAG: L,D-transpeptidase, partial [Calditrichia bacterium]